MDSLFEAVKKTCLSHGFERTYWVALSGGLDSSVLMHLLVNLRSLYPIRLRAIHIHHGLSKNADQWAMHCESICHELAVDLSLHQIDARASQGDSPEEIARQRRYEIFEKVLAPGDILLTAHHQDDQAETVLLQLFRGAGPKGLAAMSRFSRFKHGFHDRPLLNFSRQLLQQYALDHHLHWVEDESNSDNKFTRNFIRHDVMVLLKQRWPTISETISRAAEHCAESQELIEILAAQDLQTCLGSKSNTLSVKNLLLLNEVRQRQVIRLWLSENRFRFPSAIKMQHIVSDMLHAAPDKLPHVTWGNVELRRYKDDLYVMQRLQSFDPSESFVWDLKQSLRLNGRGVLMTKLSHSEGLRADIETVSIRFRRGGEVCKLPGRNHHHELKNLLQAWGIPPWLRDQVPLIYVNDQLAGVVGYFVADEFAAKEGELGFLVSLYPNEFVSLDVAVSCEPELA